MASEKITRPKAHILHWNVLRADKAEMAATKTWHTDATLDAAIELEIARKTSKLAGKRYESFQNWVANSMLDRWEAEGMLVQRG